MKHIIISHYHIMYFGKYLNKNKSLTKKFVFSLCELKDTLLMCCLPEQGNSGCNQYTNTCWDVDTHCSHVEVE